MHAAKSSACSPLHQLGQGGSFSTAGRGQASQPFGVRQILAALLVPPWTAGRSVVVLMDQSFLVALLDRVAVALIPRRAATNYRCVVRSGVPQSIWLGITAWSRQCYGTAC